MENIESLSSSIEGKDDDMRRAQINDVVQTLHTLYEAMKMPSKGQSTALHQSSNRLEIQPTAPNTKDPYKSATLALGMKKNGDAQFIKGEYDGAFTAYTQCLAYAELDSEEIGHAYANRSACFLKQGKYEQCLLDIDRALCSNYPEDKKKNLHERKEHCLSLIAKPNPSTSDEAGTSSEQASRNDREEEPAQKTTSVKEEIDREWREFTRNLNKNPQLPNTSTKVELRCNETWGRHLVATENIKTGEILSSEKYFVLMPDKYFLYEFCSYCLSCCEALIPCPCCSKVMYCSERCLTRAFDSYHRLECQIYRSRKELCENLDKKNRMALRLLLVGTNQGADMSTLMEKLTTKDIFAEKVDPTNKPFSMDYLSTLQLCRTFERPLLNGRTEPVQLVKMIIALQDVGFFDNDPNQQNVVQDEKRLSKMELFAALLLFNHTISFGLSTFDVEQLLYNFAHHKRTVGMGIHILHNMVNHSCNPNVECLIRNGEHVYFTLRPIAKGEQRTPDVRFAIGIGGTYQEREIFTFGGIFENVHYLLFCVYSLENIFCFLVPNIKRIFSTYFGIYEVFPKESRTAILSDPGVGNGFICKCEACVNDWPTYETLKTMKPIFLTKNEKKVKKELKRLLSRALRKDMSTFGRLQIFDLITRICNLLHATVKCPCYAISNCEFAFETFMKFFYDNATSSLFAEETLIREVGSSIIKISSYFISDE